MRLKFRNNNEGTNQMKTIQRVIMLGCILAAGAVRAGSLEPTGAPGPTMYTLEEIYVKLTNTLAQAQANEVRLADLEARLNASGQHVTAGWMVLIPSGSFVMGATTNMGHDSEYFMELPQHTVNIDAFYMDKFEVYGALWLEVYTWATNKGYSFGSNWYSVNINHPVSRVDWYDAIAWCNARSQRDGLTPCYTNANGTVYTNAASNSFDGGCNWAANGYRLPTEAEWERAARGGVANWRFPWSDANTIQHLRANYYATPSVYPYDTSPTQGYHPNFNTTNVFKTSPYESFAPNGYGLFDMAGNVGEWCWDWYDADYYASSPVDNPRGPNYGTQRVYRGGSYNNNAPETRAAARLAASPTTQGGNIIGFRCVRAP